MLNLCKTMLACTALLTLTYCTKPEPEPGFEITDIQVQDGDTGETVVAMPDAAVYDRAGLQAPATIWYGWIKYGDPTLPAKNCKIRFQCTKVVSATFYDWVVESANTDFSKTTTTPMLTPFYIESGPCMIKVRARNSKYTSEWKVKYFNILTPGDCWVF